MNIVERVWNQVLLLEPDIHEDHRGFFLESYRQDQLERLGIIDYFVQDNHSYSKEPGILRGLHYQQLEKAQSKLVRVTSGAIYDVVVDIRKGSPTYGEWVSFILSEYNKRMLYVPKGFAHGFCTLTPNTNIVYKVDTYYSPDHDCGIKWCDPQIGISWPISTPILSKKDELQPFLAEVDTTFSYKEMYV
ncbi:dTDP-4-dehydrorhamnose 3,5-epimerase [Virgibacillus soli]|uniref:dTDP-4-dehydrorhamnose 3,5-epimerase n=1 Tax=Paracerasibacillus soli TaxID=480284 RepID=A0ABU5CTM6_9BACI|nr:dTDP-4-dehydrorhamnose 3,5-epimerase [Virgibacillus soli]MDY0409199.1 dTDP-4-dehydrorhamnose 3,5-epimerase [Virgibacillus soli]